MFEPTWAWYIVLAMLVITSSIFLLAVGGLALYAIINVTVNLMSWMLGPYDRWQERKRIHGIHMAGDHMGQLKFHFRTYLEDKDAELVEWWCRVCDYKTRETLDNKLYVTGQARKIPEVLS